ncbi:MAG: Peroxiredoxin [Lacunisphaera sp.]|nr:Peroxiredoxin [Lacunisphaera sp.]
MPPDKTAVADKAFADIQVIANAPNVIANARAHTEPPMSREESKALMAACAELVVPLGEKFLADYPADPRRWKVVAILLYRTPAFTGPDAAAKKEAWEKRRADWHDQLVAAPDADEATVASLLEHDIYAAAGARGFSEQAPDLAKAGALVDLMAQRAPHSDRRRFAERHYLEELAKKDPAAAEARLRRLAAEKEINPALAQQSVGMLLAIDGKRAPLELKFTALDGSAIDLANYRGKVVLVDFWATWCVPCMEEMPNVKRVYQAYHDQGLEIIGVSLDRSPRNPAKPSAFEKTADQLKEFLVKENMPWPEHYDGKWWDNEFSRRFALGSIPASFLIGKDGRIISTENHGEKLEANVRQALGL